MQLQSEWKFWFSKGKTVLERKYGEKKVCYVWDGIYRERYSRDGIYRYILWVFWRWIWGHDGKYLESRIPQYTLVYIRIPFVYFTYTSRILSVYQPYTPYTVRIPRIHFVYLTNTLRIPSVYHTYTPYTPVYPNILSYTFRILSYTSMNLVMFSNLFSNLLALKFSTYLHLTYLDFKCLGFIQFF